MEADLRISIKDYHPNKILKIQLSRAPNGDGIQKPKLVLQNG